MTGKIYHWPYKFGPSYIYYNSSLLYGALGTACPLLLAIIDIAENN